MLGPLLLGYVNNNIDIKGGVSSAESWKELPTHRDENQVQLDVDRSFIYYPNGASWLLVTYHNGSDKFAQTSPQKRSKGENRNFLT